MAEVKDSPQGASSSDGVNVICAPSRGARKHKWSIFLAGTTSPTDEPDWRQTLVEAISGWDYAVDIFNPVRHDWDSTWKEDYSDNRWAEQVEWELDIQDEADIVVVFFHSATVAPISLLELGLCARSGKAVVCALEGYSKSGNVEAVCRRYGATFVTSPDALAATVSQKLILLKNK